MNKQQTDITNKIETTQNNKEERPPQYLHQHTELSIAIRALLYKSHVRSQVTNSVYSTIGNVKKYIGSMGERAYQRRMNQRVTYIPPPELGSGKNYEDRSHIIRPDEF